MNTMCFRRPPWQPGKEDLEQEKAEHSSESVLYVGDTRWRQRMENQAAIMFLDWYKA